MLTKEPELQGPGLRGGVMEFNKLLEKIKVYLPAEKIGVVEEAYKFASEKHQGQVRLSGEPFLEHPLQTAYVLAELQFDASSLAAALLHDIPEDTGLPIADIEARFGPEIAKLVDGVTKLGKVALTGSGAVANATQAENLRKMLLAMAEDLRVVFIKIADRLHNMRTLRYLPKERQLAIAQETMEIYAPLAHRLGIWELKWQLEDLAFSYLQPQEYQQIARLVDTKRAQREKFIEQAIVLLKKEFERVGLEAEVSGRPKHIYSIYQKIKKYATMGKYFDEIYDLFAMRVIVESEAQCYNTVGIVHSLWHPLPDTFDDYIGNPKPNGYRALHTAVMCLGTTPIEIQIMTREMYHIAEYGLAAHWRYKEGGKSDIKFEEKIAWLRQLIEWHRELTGAEEFLESVKTDIFIDQVFVYTPKGEIKDLPKGATPLDFAYRVHTDLGHRCIGAKVNGKLVPFNYTLKNGDVVEVISAKAARAPSLDWLNPNLGYVRTSHAQTKIRQWFNKQTRTENIERGRQMLDKELRRLGIKTEREVLAGLFGYPALDDFHAAVGDGSVTSHQIVLKLAAQEDKAEQITATAPLKMLPSGVQVMGVGDLMTSIAQCCHPVPGDRIIGYITRSRGVSVHRADCHNIINEDEKERLIPVEWGQTDLLYPVKVQVDAWDRVGLMRDVTTVVAEEKINISTVSLTNGNGQNITMFLTLEIKGLEQLSQILKKIETVKGVVGVSRIGPEASRQTTGDKPPAGLGAGDAGQNVK
jgi:GTP diphosphokinase / guanosine-3',5'-bis(diphosphate) 3'-diphosphatase